jgi:RNA polymerase sigma-70 factor, ECF subfamily
MLDAEEQIAAVAAAKQGDLDAWETLYRHVYARLHAYLARRVGLDHAEDCVSDTMARAIASIERLKLGPAGFDGWVFGIARRVVAEHYRQAGKFRREVVASQQMAVDAHMPDDELSQEVDQVRLRRQFARLPPGEQELLELRVVAGLSAEQVAAVLGKRPGAVRTAQSRALAHLRRLMELDRD